MRIDVTLVACRRPDALARSLASLDRHVLSRFEIERVWCNVDPAFGTEDAGAECEALLCSRFANVTVWQPETPSFGAAVRRVWSQADTATVLHLEDDWEALGPIGPEQVRPLLGGDVATARPAVANRNVVPGAPFLTRKVRSLCFPYLGVRRRLVSQFSTGPMFAGPRFCAATRA